MVAILPNNTTTALDLIRTHARSAAYHRTMRQRWLAITASPASLRAAQVDPTRLARQHEVSSGIADTRLKHALADARDADVDPGMMQVAVVTAERDGVADADREMPIDVGIAGVSQDRPRYVIDKRPGSSTFGFHFLAS